jgi:hypothetical protein
MALSDTVGGRGYQRLPSRMLWSLMRVRFTLAYAMALTAVAATLLALGSRVQNSVVSHVSTNLHNLANGHLDTLVASAFVTEGHDIYVILPGLVCLLAVGELIWRGRRVMFAFALGHLGATVVVAVGLTVAIAAGWLPISVAHASDVGISYGAAGVLGALTAVIPRYWRPAWISWWLAVALVAACWPGFTPVGHMIALILGMGLSTRLETAVTWTRTRMVLLFVGALFGYLMITGSSSMLASAIAGPAGTAVALIAHWAARHWWAARSTTQPISA